MNSKTRFFVRDSGRLPCTLKGQPVPLPALRMVSEAWEAVQTPLEQAAWDPGTGAPLLWGLRRRQNSRDSHHNPLHRIIREKMVPAWPHPGRHPAHHPGCGADLHHEPQGEPWK